jgi:hypothetical protein
MEKVYTVFIIDKEDRIISMKDFKDLPTIKALNEFFDTSSVKPSEGRVLIALVEDDELEVEEE